MKRNIYACIFCFYFVSISFGQNKKEEIEDIEHQKVRKNAIAITGGTTGIGFEYARYLTRKMTLRLKYNSLNVENYEINDFELDGQNTDFVLNLKNKSYDFLLEYKPFNSSFKLVFGAGYFTDFSISGNLSFDSEQKVGDITLTKEDFGDIQIDANWNSSFAPYLGLGFGRAIPNKRLGLALEVGGYFIGESEATLVGTRLLTPTEEENKETIKDGFSKLTIIPNIQLKLAYSF
ncbi:hypothetical protein [uncultured Polaribacter sp.]|uniref:hypothetical protein n=1 Tax=uncultured Polaribacter sp. TaxID=174711 RepID=UPI00261EEF8F|nr:hypothetical protein [uncultured Polaribacter sp.]